MTDDAERQDPDFESTEIAFASMSDEDLRQAYWMFRSFQSPLLSTWGPKLLSWAVQQGLPLESLIRSTVFRQFCGGETVQECVEKINHLGSFGVATILDYSVEGLDGDDEERSFDAAVVELKKVMEFAAQRKDIPFAVFKPSAIGSAALWTAVASHRELTELEERQWALVRGRFRDLCASASVAGVPILIDAEQSWWQPAVDACAEEMMREFNGARPIVYNTVQMYRNDRLAYLRHLHQFSQERRCWVGVKLVRGAYMEKERLRAQRLNYASPIWSTKDACDAAFNEGLEFCVNHIDCFALCCGTHNEESTRYLTELMTKAALTSRDERIYFSQLLGMSDHITFSLSKAGYRVAKYMPYGPVREVLPYLSRRARENSSISNQSSRELSLIRAELKRRRLVPQD